MKRFAEILKNIAIVLLLCSLVVLVLLALPGNLTSFSGLEDLLSPIARLPEAPSSAQTEHAPAMETALPLMLSVKNESGRLSLREAEETLRRTYGETAPYLAQALATAAEGTALSETPALTNRTGVLFLYGGAVPADALCRWAGGEQTAVTGNYFCYLLCCEGSGAVLYAANSETCMRYTTTVDGAALQTLLAQYATEGDLLAGDREGILVHPFTPWETQVRLSRWQATSEFSEDYGKNLAVALDFNPYGSGTYTEADGATVYTEGSRSLTIRPAGVVEFAAADLNYTRFTVQEDTSVAYIDMAGELLSLMAADLGSSGRFRFCGYEQTDSTVTVRFCYVVGGIAVYPAGAEAVFQNGALQKMTCQLRRFRRETGTLTAMPAAQAAVIARPGALLLPAYHLSDSGVLSAGWKEVF